MSQPTADARHIARAVDNLTTQVRRVAGAMQTPVAERHDATDDATTTPDDGAAQRCAAQLHPSSAAHLPAACIRPVRHPEDHTDGYGTCWTESLAVYPLPDWLAAGSRDLSIPEHRPAPADDGSRCAVCGSLEVRYRNYREQPFCWPCANGEQPAPDADEEQQRTTRRASLGNLLARLERGLLMTEEKALLRQHVDTELREADTVRAVAAGNKRHVQVMYAELQQVQARIEATYRTLDARTAQRDQARGERDRSDEAARRALEQRQEMAAERHALQRRAERLEVAAHQVLYICGDQGSDVQDILRTALDCPTDTDQQDTVESLRAKLDEATAILRRVRSVLATLKGQGATGQGYHQAITNALAGPRPDTDQPTTEEN